MTYFTWKEKGLTKDCISLEAMAARFEESAKLMRKMANEGFRLEKKGELQFITHNDQSIFESWGFISEEAPYTQLNLILDEKQ